MEEYNTYIFKKTREKTRKRLIYNLSLLAAIGGIIYMYVVGILGIGLGLMGMISLILVILQMKIYDEKYMGITAYGERKEKLTINEEYFIVGDAKIPFSQLKNLVIYVDEYWGMPREVMGVHHGGNNEVTFTRNGNKFSFNYIIKNKADFQGVRALVERIEKSRAGR